MAKICCRKVRASYTIEAAFISPIVLYIIIALIYLSFYLHDYGRIQTIINESQTLSKGLVIKEVDIDTGIQSFDTYLNRTVFYPIDNDFADKVVIIKNYVHKRCKDKLLTARVKDVQVDINSLSVSISIKSKMNFPIKVIKKFFVGSEDVVIESKEKSHNPTNFIRGFEVSAKTGEKIDIKKIIKGLKK